MVDGTPVSTELTVPTGEIQAALGGVMIGQEQQGIGGIISPEMALAGIIDEFYVFDSALELQDIQSSCLRQ